MAQITEHEMQTAVAAVRMACRVTASVQSEMFRSGHLTKKDRSPVTVADFASQAIVCQQLQRDLAPVIVAEENADMLRKDGGVISQQVTDFVGKALDDEVAPEDVFDWIDLGRGSATATGRFWTLDPIDGTKGFLRGGQYAVALGLIDAGQVVFGVLGCPGLPLDHEDPEGLTGVVLMAVQGRGAVALDIDQTTLEGPKVSVSGATESAGARFCESVDSGHTDQERSAKIATALGITAEPVRMDSQAKYAAVARGEAEIYLRIPREGYIEHIWDHAAGAICVTEAGGRVTDIIGKPLDFGQGATLAANSGIVATCGPIHDAVVAAVQHAMPATA